MDRFNRLVVAVIALAVAAAAGVVLAAAAGLWLPPPTLGATLGAELTASLTAPTAWAIALAAVVLVVALAVIAAEVGPRRPREVLVSESEGGDVTVALTTVKEFVERVVEGLSDVRRAVASVRPEPDGLRVVCHVEANASAVLDALGEAIRQEVEREVAAHLCLEVRRVEVRARMSLRLRARTVVK